MFKTAVPFNIIICSIILVSFFTILLWTLFHSLSVYDIECDNIGETCFSNSRYLPIDVVYTWVNGSDPFLQKDIEFHKNLLETSSTENQKINKKLNIFTGRSLLSVKKETLSIGEQSGDSPFVASPDCPIEGCIPAPAVISVSGVEKDIISLENIKSFIGFQQAIDIKYANPENSDATFLFVKFQSIDDVDQAVGKIVTSGAITIKFKPVYYTSQHGEGPYVKTSSTLMDLSTCNIPSVEEMSGLLSYDSTQRLVCVDKDSQWSIRRVCKHTYPQVTYLVWPPWEKYQIGGLSSSDVGAHRFADNEELRYSLRSLSAYAPWVRNIYIVTNGQIPTWLNIDHPRIKIISHHEIFQNKSQLPTFSSPAIETSLHNIPGLSDHFLYFNDDVILGRSVYPEDFISSNGYKIFLAWSIPNCNTGCPSNWLGDGYCDLACNVSACNFDGDDCTKDNPSIVDVANNIINLNVGADAYAQMYCNPGCSHSWICDKYCDPACNVQNCGFDAGDCGVKEIKEKLFEISGLTLDSNNTVFNVSRGITAMFVNISIPDVTVTAAHYEGIVGTSVRTATISLPHNILTITLFKNKTESVPFTLELSSDEKLYINLSIDTYPSEVPYVKLIPSINFAQKEIVQEKWDIPTQVNMDDFVHGSIDQINKIINSVDVSKLVDDDKAEYQKLSELVAKGVLTEKGKWYKLGTYIKSKVLEAVDRIPQRSLKTIIKEFLPQRILLDTFANSLHHVNNLYTKHFGKHQRKVLSHMPFLINKTIIRNLHARFPEQFNNTAANRFRSSNDMQFAFSYYYFIIHAIKTENINDLLYRADVNKDGKFSVGELDVLQTLLFALPISPTNRTLFNETLTNCTRDMHFGDLTPENLVTCPNISSMFSLASLRNVSLYPHEIVNDKDVTFKMLKSNTTKVRIDLDYIRNNPKKFICLNDNMDHKSDSYDRNFQMLRDFYETMYPKPSPFEHREGSKNNFIYKSEYMSQTYNFSFKLQILYIMILFFMILVCVCFLKRRSLCRYLKGLVLKLCIY